MAVPTSRIIGTNVPLQLPCDDSNAAFDAHPDGRNLKIGDEIIPNDGKFPVVIGPESVSIVLIVALMAAQSPTPRRLPATAVIFFIFERETFSTNNDESMIPSDPGIDAINIVMRMQLR